MADKYLYHLGSNTAPYESAATAATTLMGLINGTTVAKGETIWVHSAHLEETTLIDDYTYISPSAADAEEPQRLICVDNFTDMNLSSGARIFAATGANRTVTSRGIWYIHGVSFRGSAREAGFGTARLSTVYNNSFFIVDCKYPGMTSYNVRFGDSVGNFAATTYIYSGNFTFTCLSTSASISLGMGTKIFHNLIVDCTTAKPDYLFELIGPGTTEILDSDFSALTTATALINGSNHQIVRFINCALPTSVPILANAERHQPKVYVINSSSGNTNHDWELHTFEGNVILDTGVYATTDPALYESGTYYSLKMTTINNVSRFFPLYSEWVHKWYDAGEHTLDVECLVGEDDAAALTTDELYLEVDYISGASSPLGSRSTTAPDILTTGGNVTAGTTAWTGDSYTTERTHKLSATVTSSKNGYIRYRVCLAKPSTIVYFNPV